MSLANGRLHMALPGPSIMPDSVLQAMHRPAPDIYDPALHDLAQGLVADLKYVAQTDGNVAIYIANGHGVWEAALSNCIAPGETVLMPATGVFGHGWADMATGIGAEVQVLEHGRNTPIDPERVRAALLADTGRKIKAVLGVHVDTSTSVRSDIAALRAVLDEVGHPALLMADCVASLGCDTVQMDDWGVDVLISASQKGMMVPPGLGFVFFNDRAAQVRAAMPRVSRYWDWGPRANPNLFYEYFGGTAPTHHLWGLRAALDLIKAETIEGVWSRHQTLAQAIWAACDHWGAPVAMNVADIVHRSHAVTSVMIGAPNGDRLREWCTQNTGVSLGIGLGMGDDTDPSASGYFRIGHMGHLNAHMVLGLLGSIEAGLDALCIPHQSGGISAAARVISAASGKAKPADRP
ncbi:pyridoxal-phosphate-dependent aminotransferase family protein [Pelagimonas varians]|uniref:Soluble hydrogenase 42 kDa subunit n=1 Tax=Pelagimonas varians TaxID=696760 RepID=A0A238KGN9_9RHOB|nr:aminotransferase class V-fold PLP-dependent enzyme [Pelagimonas varians]PYG32301.1 alanine-glyoxylate transaminase/serine-glyoxylate transaminase/serine-pyruvate transaminase [Pelagimonas varians]SMX41941.1 Soluble hydrogenase 42 kDa subunit [Pelagimonas varians]